LPLEVVEILGALADQRVAGGLQALCHRPHRRSPRKTGAFAIGDQRGRGGLQLLVLEQGELSPGDSA
jgi:hypothetical protein